MKKPVVAFLIAIPLVALIISGVSGEFKSDASKHSFENTEKFVARFEAPDRIEWQKPDEVLTTLKVQKGSHIADIGAGSGFFTRRFAKAAGPTGTATGFEIEPGMVEYMKKDARKLGLKNYHAELVSPDNPPAGKERFDMIFMCNTYHHIAGRPAYLGKMDPSLKKGGRIVIIDYRKDSKFGPPAHYKLEEKSVLEEFAAAGYKLSSKHDFLPNQYMLVFVRK